MTISNSAGAVTSERVKVTVLGAERPWLGITRVSLSKKKVHLALEAKPGATYKIQYTESIGEPVWLPLGNITMWGSGTIYDKFDPLRPARFYRAVELP